MHSSFTLSFFSELVLNKPISITENRSFQLDIVVNDTEYQGLDRSLMLHFNVSILPVSIQFPNTTYQFTVNRNAANFSQVRMTYSFVLLFKVTLLEFLSYSAGSLYIQTNILQNLIPSFVVFSTSKEWMDHVSWPVGEGKEVIS